MEGTRGGGGKEGYKKSIISIQYPFSYINKHIKHWFMVDLCVFVFGFWPNWIGALRMSFLVSKCYEKFIIKIPKIFCPIAPFRNLLKDRTKNQQSPKNYLNVIKRK